MADRSSKHRQEDEDAGKNAGKSFAELQQEQRRQEVRGHDPRITSRLTRDK